MEDKLIPTLAMTRDPRLRKLFAICGMILDSEAAEPTDHDRLTEVMLDIAPEYLPPDDEVDEDDWIELIGAATRRA